MGKKNIQPGDSFSQSFDINLQHTAKALGSGELDVFSTPSMIAFMENTAMKLLSGTLEDGYSTVGTEIHAKHLKASGVGERVDIKATVKSVQEKFVDFEITAVNQNGVLIGTATHSRAIIVVRRFMARADGKVARDSHGKI